jgi:hypothetical protein
MAVFSQYFNQFWRKTNSMNTFLDKWIKQMNQPKLDGRRHPNGDFERKNA